MLYIILMLLAFLVLMFGLRFLIGKFLKVPEKISRDWVFGSLLVCFAAAWITDLIGVHGIFGAFISGIILPRDNNFTVQLIEKIEDLTTFIFLPLYFAFSGLRINLFTLDSGLAWGGVFLTIAFACLGKIMGVTIAGKLLGQNWREAFTVGILMNCKGLVEIIVLNIGLDAGIIDIRVFTIMVVMALVTTFMTSPLVSLVYPTRLIPHFGNDKPDVELAINDQMNHVFRAVLLVIDPDLEQQNLARMFFESDQRNLLHVCQTILVTDRESSVLRATRTYLIERSEPITQLVQNLSTINTLTVHTETVIVNSRDFPLEVIDLVSTHTLNFVLISWLPIYDDGEQNISEIVSFLLVSCPATFGIYIPAQTLPISGSSGKIIVPFFGGTNNCEAVNLGLYFSKHTPVVITRYYISDATKSNESEFLTDEDKRTLKFVKEMAHENKGLEFTKRKCKNPNQILQILSQDLTHYSLAIVGIHSLSYFPENTSDNRAIGNLATYIEEQHSVNMIVINKSKRSPNYPFSQAALSSTRSTYVSTKNDKEIEDEEDDKDSEEDLIESKKIEDDKNNESIV
jgi:hypothetical protein